jgi:hypothetical protein
LTPGTSPAESVENVSTADDTDSESSPEKHLEETVDIVGCLVELIPTLTDLLDDEDDDPDTEATDVALLDQYVQQGMRMFPKAHESLIKRLVESNWRGRQNLRRLRRKSTTYEPPPRVEGVDCGAPHEEPPKQRQHGTRLPTQFRRGRSEYFPLTGPRSDGGLSTVISTMRSTTAAVDQDSVTSISESNESVVSQLQVPGPPVNLEDKKLFYCPFCHFELPLNLNPSGMTMDDWVNHVYLDLEPYLCTYGDCGRAKRPFGVKKDWFQHEQDCHRSRLVWVCGSCTEELASENDLEEHLRSTHKELLSSANLSTMLENCKRYSQKPLLEQDCPLCGVSGFSGESLSNHLGEHLEKLSLAATKYNYSSDDIDPFLNDYHADAEHGAEMRLGEFVQEQSQLHRFKQEEAGVTTITVTKGPPSSVNAVVEVDHSRKLNTTGSPDLDDDMADSSALDEADKEMRKARDDLRLDKVANYLDTQQARDKPVENKNITVQTIKSAVPPRYDNFVGRDEDLDNIHKYLSTPGHICAVSGRGGIGKTATAAEYSYRFESEYAYIFWVEAETSGGCADKYNLISSCFDLGGRVHLDQAGTTALVRERLSRTERRWLLIFDNVDDWTEIAPYIPQNLPRTKGSVLITTRSSNLLFTPSWSHDLVGLDIWTLEESQEFLLTEMQPKQKRVNWREHPEYSLAEEVAKVVEGLPLAISMIAGYVKESRCTLEEFLEIWGEVQSRASARAKKSPDDEHDALDATIDALWDIGIGELSVNARNLLDILSFLDAEAIQKEILVGDHTESYLEFLNAGEFRYVLF